jgi:hypothetical protein
MCKISDQIKLCSCEIEQLEELKNYWVLRRPYESDEAIIGMIMVPAARKGNCR